MKSQADANLEPFDSFISARRDSPGNRILKELARHESGLSVADLNQRVSGVSAETIVDALLNARKLNLVEVWGSGPTTVKITDVGRRAIIGD